MRLKVGARAPLFVLRDLYGREVDLRRYAGAHVLLCFNRAAVCPLCNMRMHLLSERYATLQEKGMYVIAFFESAVGLAREYLPRLQAPFPLIPDLGGEAYGRYGLTTSWIGTARGTMRRSVYREARRLHLGMWQLIRGFLAMDGHKFRLPADFILAPDQTIRVAHYGQDSGDFLPFSDLDAYLARIPPVSTLPFAPAPAFAPWSYGPAPNVPRQTGSR
jgi:peroxiredoxin